MKNFIRKGETLDFSVALNGTAVKSGELVAVGALIGSAITSIGLGEVGALNLKGVYDVPKAAGAIAQGDKLYLIAADKTVTKTDTGNTYAGIAFAAATSGAETVQLLLTNGI